MAKKREFNMDEILYTNPEPENEEVTMPENVEKGEVNSEVDGEDMTQADVKAVNRQNEYRHEMRRVTRRLYNRMIQMDFTQPLSAEDVEIVVRYLAIKEVGY